MPDTHGDSPTDPSPTPAPAPTSSLSQPSHSHSPSPSSSVRGDALASEFTSSLNVDRRMYREDIAASIAHARMLGRQGIISQADADTLIDGLQTVRQEIADGKFRWRVELEDIHMNVEARLFELVGDVAGTLHTARSRNDQVATDFRLYAMRRAQQSRAACRRLQRALLQQADDHRTTLMPGYTHLQRAQPVLFAHVMLAYFEMLQRDADAFSHALRAADCSPLGSGALAGTTYPIDREAVAEELGFSRISANSMDAVSDRDFALDYVFAAAKTMLHLSRLAEDVVVWSSQEFGYVRLSDAYSTGSSMMPQKRNPDYAELIRGKAGSVAGALTALMMTLKGLPMTYNRDLQEDKRQLMDAADTVDAALEAAAGMVAEMQVDVTRCAEAAADPLLVATDVADTLVRNETMPFREAYARVKDALSGDESSDAAGRAAPQMSAQEAADMRDVPGGTAPAQVAAAVMRAYGELSKAQQRGEW